MEAGIYSGKNGRGEFSFNGNTTLSFSVVDSSDPSIQLSFFPNPADNYLKVLSNMEGVTFRITDLLNQEKMKGRLPDSGEINVSGLTEGIYIMEFFYSGTKESKRLVIK